MRTLLLFLLLSSLTLSAFLPLEKVRGTVGKYKEEKEDIVTHFSYPLEVSGNYYWVLDFEIKGALSLSIAVDAKKGDVVRNKDTLQKIFFLAYVAKELKDRYFSKFRNHLIQVTSTMDEEIQANSSLKNALVEHEFSTSIDFLIEGLEELEDMAYDISELAKSYSDDFLAYEAQLSEFSRKPSDFRLEKLKKSFNESFSKLKDIADLLEEYKDAFDSLVRDVQASDLSEEEKFYVLQSMYTRVSDRLITTLREGARDKEKELESLLESKEIEAKGMSENLLARIERKENEFLLKEIEGEVGEILSYKALLKAKGVGLVETLESLWEKAKQKFEAGEYGEMRKLVKDIKKLLPTLKRKLESLGKEEKKEGPNIMPIIVGVALVVVVALLLKYKREVE